MIYNTPYDDAFRTLTVDCPRLLIPMMNEIFNKHYTGDEAVTLHPNEHFLIGQDGDEKKRITDSIFSIQSDRYLFECMAYSDDTLILRVFEYAIQDGLENSILSGNVLTVSIPEAAVLYLRSGKAPKELSIQIITKAGSLCFPIPTMRVSDYSIDDLFTRKLYFLIPFYIFTYEREFRNIEGDESALEKLRNDYSGLVSRLDNAVDHGQLSAYYRRTIRDMSARVTNSIASKYDNIREGVNTVMGGQVLEHEGKRIYNEGRAEGKAEGIAEGTMSEKESMSVNLYKHGVSVETIAESAKVSSNLVRQWIESAAKQAQTV